MNILFYMSYNKKIKWIFKIKFIAKDFFIKGDALKNYISLNSSSLKNKLKIWTKKT